jgi:Beta-propeller repeat/Cep192 domain 4/HYDIN/CFA65/VesB-like, Ig-like domain
VTRNLARTFAFLLFLSILASADAVRAASAPEAKPRHLKPHAAPASAGRFARAVKAYYRLPLVFEANRVHESARSAFVARGKSYSIFLTRDGAALRFRNVEGRKAARTGHSAAVSDAGALRLHLVGAERSASITGVQELPGKANYFIGRDRSKWRRNVPLYGKVRVAGVYPGIDLAYYGNQGKLECDFVVAPGADPAAIRFDVTSTPHSSARGKKTLLHIAPNGDLVVDTRAGELRFRKPVVYQQNDQMPGGGVPQQGKGDHSSVANRKFLDGGFALLTNNEVAFKVSGYNRSKPLIIDPVLSYSSYLGGNDLDQVNAVAVDESGMAYVAGWTVSTDFPAQGSPYQSSCDNCDPAANYWDAFVAKFDPTQSGAASLVYSTYLGGDDQDSANGIAVDSAGNAYITGVTYSFNFPLSLSGYSSVYAGAGDAFISKIGPAGSTLPYSSDFGGPQLDQGLAIALGGPDTPYITGSTCSAGLAPSGAFQTTAGGCPSAFLAVFDTAASGSASLVYATYLAGSSGTQQGNAIAVDSHGNALVAGQTTSYNFPVTLGAYDTSCGTDGHCESGLYADAFVAEVTPNLSLSPPSAQLVYSTFLGGGGVDSANAIAVDGAGDAYVTGYTKSADFPTTSGAFQVSQPGGSGTHAFLSKLIPDATLSPASSQLVYSTYLGGSSYDTANAIAVDSAGQAYVAGYTSSGDFPLANPIQNQCNGCPGAVDGFVTKFNASGSALIFSTFLNGSQEDQATGIAVDSSDNADVGGFTYSPDFLTSSSAYQNANAGKDDGFFLKISDLILPVAIISPVSLSFPDTDVAATSSPLTVTLTNSGDAGLTLTASVSNPASVYTTGDFEVVSSSTTCTTGLTIAPGSSCTISVTFTPASAGDRTGLISIQDNAYGSPQTVNLKGKGLSLAMVSVSPTSLGFGDQLTGSASVAQQVTLSNSGTGPLDISSIGTSLSDFAETNSCGTQVPAGSSCNINVSFSPSASGALMGALTINDDGQGNPHQVSLSGTGISVLLSSPSLSFADQRVGTSSNAQTVTLTNSGKVAVTLASIATNGDFNETDDCPLSPSTLIPSGACTLNIIFAPTATGARQGSVQVFDETDGVPQTIALSGNGVQPSVAFSPTSLDFGSIVVGDTSAAKTATLMNASKIALTISSIAASGDFAQTNTCPVSPDTLAAGAKCTLTVTFTPTAPDVRRGSVTVTDDAAGSPQSLSLDGIGAAPAVIISPSSLAFNSQGVATTSGAQSATLTNSGSVPLTISSIAASGDFAQTNTCPVSPDTLAAGAKCTLTVTFTPTVTDVRRGSVTVADDASGSPQVLQLSGTGVPAFSLASNSTSSTVIRGVDSTTFEISASSSFGFNDGIDLSCSGNSPAVCSFAPASITPGQTSTLTLTGLSAFTTSFLQFTVRAVSGTQAASLNLTALISDFSISSSPGSATIAAGQSEVYTVTLSPINGYNRAVSFGCAVSPPGTTCTVSPGSVTLDGVNPAAAQMTITTVSPGLTPPSPGIPPPPPRAGFRLLLLLFALLLTAGLPGICGARRAASWRSRFVLAMALLLALGWTACGGGGQAQLPQTGNGTAPMTYTVTLTGTSGSLTHSATANLTVK